MSSFHSKFIPAILILAITLLPIALTATNEVPTYHELYRPGYHFSPPKNWMNDPNGLLYLNGIYHLYYQYNPNPNVSVGQMNWGHATSSDLVNWENQPLAIPEGNDLSIWSGSAFPDVNNTSGLCDPARNGEGCVLAFYASSKKEGVSVSLAYSNDYGYTFTQYQGNPIIKPGQDPKIFWYEPEKKWVLVFTWSHENKMKIYSSTDLKTWTYLSTFEGAGNPHAELWECPDLFPINIENEQGQKWVLLLSGNATNQYFIGEFDGKSFINSNPKDTFLTISHYGSDFYAGYTYNNAPNNRRILIGWLDRWDYAQIAPTQGWRGQQSLPRELRLVRYPEGLRLTQEPISELNQLRYNHVHYSDVHLNRIQREFKLDVEAAQFELNVTFVLPTEEVFMPTEFGIKVFVGKDQETIIGYNMKSQSLFIDRTNSGVTNFSSNFTHSMTQGLTPENGTITLRIFADQSTLEVFANSGKLVMNCLIYPNPEQNQVLAYAVGGRVTVSSIDSWLMKSIWKTSTSSGDSNQKQFLQA